MRNAVVTELAPKPMGPYSQAVVEGDFIFVAGQGAINPQTGKRELGDVRSETKRLACEASQPRESRIGFACGSAHTIRKTDNEAVSTHETEPTLRPIGHSHADSDKSALGSAFSRPNLWIFDSGHLFTLQLTSVSNVGERREYSA